jgi:hypothetical protein
MRAQSMKIEEKSKIISTTEEHLTLDITFDPSNDGEERLVALIATLTDLVKEFNKLNTEGD